MKFNKWTLGLAAVGVVSLASAARADETKMSQVQTLLSNTTLSGYVDTSMMWQLGQQNNGPTPQYTPGNVPGDGFNLNAIDLALDKPLGEGQWSAGYHVELMGGPDSVPNSGLQSALTSSVDNLLSKNGEQQLEQQELSYVRSLSSRFGGGGSGDIRQAYMALRTPVANSEIDWKVGVFDTIIGYESSSDPLNPNYTRSYGYFLEPTTHTGILGTYKINDQVSVSVGVADGSDVGPSAPSGIDGRATWETQKSYMGAIALTAPDSWGWAKGATLNAGVINADNGSAANYAYVKNQLANQSVDLSGFANLLAGVGTTSWYVGATVPTPLTALKVGGSFDYLDLHNGGSVGNPSDDSSWDAAIYGNYQYNDKLSFNLRGEYLNDGAGVVYPTGGPNTSEAEEVTATVSYQLWANVLSRVELRWDHVDNAAFDTDTATGASPVHKNAYLLALNLIYQF
jgi:hypothetical protein